MKKKKSDPQDVDRILQEIKLSVNSLLILPECGNNLKIVKECYLYIWVSELLMQLLKL